MNTFYYKNDRNVGHNLYCRPGSGVPGDVTGQEVASYWYSAVKQYDFLKEPDVLHANVNAGKKIAISRAFLTPGINRKYALSNCISYGDSLTQRKKSKKRVYFLGHFTQLIWASSRYFGVGKAHSRSGKIIVVANYEPVGNVSGQFQNNVFPPLPENVNAVVMSPHAVPRIPRGHYELLRSTAPPPLSDTASTGSDTMSVSSGQ